MITFDGECYQELFGGKKKCSVGGVKQASTVGLSEGKSSFPGEQREALGGASPLFCMQMIMSKRLRPDMTF